MSGESEIGTLIVVVLKARNLNDKHTFRKQDAYAKVALNGSEKKTRVDVKGGQHPVWDDEVRFPVMKTPGGKFRKMEISCWAKEPREDDLLGKATLDITDIIRSGEFDEWVALAIDDTIRGDIYLEITYYAHGPPPPVTAVPVNKPLQNLLAAPSQANLMRRPSKLKASERLSRPVTVNTSQRPQHHHSNSFSNSPLSPQGSSSHYHNKNAQLPPLPEAQSPQQSNSGSQPLPSFLRPGTASGNHTRPYSDPIISASPPRRGAYGSASPPSTPNPYLAPASYDRPISTPPVQAAQPNPYLTSTTPSPSSNVYGQPPKQGPLIFQSSSAVPTSYTPPPAPYTSAVSYTPAPHQQTSLPPPSTTTYPVTAPTSPPPLWAGPPTDTAASGSSFFFPMPNISGPPADSNPYQPPWAGSPPRGASPYDPDHYNRHRAASDPRADPSLYSRYQTPLPLPPGSKGSTPSSGNSASSPPRPPRTASPPKPARQASPAGPDARRLMELQRAEDEATRRREQEQRDLELAMQLDKELNL